MISEPLSAKAAAPAATNAEHHYESSHVHSHGACCAHDDTETGLKVRLLFVLAAAICLVLGAVTGWTRPGQAELAALWSLAGVILAGLPILRDTLAGLRAKSAENTDFYMNQFITLAVAACVATGHYAAGGIVAIVLLVGHILEARGMLGAGEAIDRLLDLSRTRARRITNDGVEEEIDAELLVEGDRIRLRPGDTLPADGIVMLGRSTVNQATITGESIPVEVAPATTVFAGTTNLTGALEVRVTSAGERTVLGRVRTIVEEAQATRAPIVRLTEEYARYYLPLVLLVAGFVLFFTHDFQRSISILIVSIPCAFIMAGPTAMVAALASASRLGILVKSVRFFEAAHEIDTIVFDKTGTLTTGELKVELIEPESGMKPERLLLLAAAAEAHSTHPLGRAVVSLAQAGSTIIPEATDLREEHGRGVSGMVDGQTIRVGRFSWLHENQIDINGAEKLHPNDSAMGVAIDRTYVGTIYFRDSLRKEAISVATQLRDEGIDRVVMLTGDRPGVAENVAAELGIAEFRAECLPEQKREAVEKLKAAGHRVLVVGDGVNDAPALAAGHVSIAMGALGSDVAIQSADVALMSGDLRRIVDFLRLAHQALRTVNQNIMGGFFFVAVAVFLAAAGFISPIAAAFLHEIGALFVILNSVRLLRFAGTS